MTVKDFVHLEASGCLFVAVNANKQGYMTKPDVLSIADKNIMKRLYGDWEVIGFEPNTARRIKIYIKSQYFAKN